MANFFENLPPCIWFEGGEKRNAIASLLAGLLFFTGWWLSIDAAFVYPNSFVGTYFVIGIIGTVSLFMVNSVTTAQIQGDSYSGGCMGPRGAKLWLFVGFVLGFSALIASCWILFSEFVGDAGEKRVLWAGLALFFQNVFIFGGSLCLKFGRVEDPWG